jgi:DNA-binding Lrp family transcriptional regulator
MADSIVPVLATRRIDEMDRKILRVLQEDATLAVAEIGERVGLSATPCWKRVQRMESEGIITGRVALVDQDKIGLGLSVFVSVESNDHSERWFIRTSRSHVVAETGRTIASSGCNRRGSATSRHSSERGPRNQS